jgi:hypothetical protein
MTLRWSCSLNVVVSGVDMQIEGPAGVCSSADKYVLLQLLLLLLLLPTHSPFSPRAKGNLRVETPMDPLAAPGPISFLLRNGTETGGDGRKRTYEVGDACLALI